MKIKRLIINEIVHRPLLNGLKIDFSELSNNGLNVNCFIGVNGSGKSQLVETIADIFLWVDLFYRTENINTQYKSSIIPFQFEINYSIVINGNGFSIKIFNEKSTVKIPKPEIIVFDHLNNIVPIKSEEEYKKYLPSKIIGYSSGENETISTPFYLYYDDYAKYTGDKAKSKTPMADYEPRFYFMDYNTNLGIAISNLIFEEIDEIKNELKIKEIKRFQIVLQTKQKGAPLGEIKLTKELDQWKKQLICCATCYEYNKKTEQYILDFYNNKATRDVISHYFKNSYLFYTSLYKFELLNNLMINKNVRDAIKAKRKKRNLETKMPTVPDMDKVLHYSELKLVLQNDQVIDYLSLSDGEHQFMNVFGTLKMVNQENSLFLLDEPETHFNPHWRRTFIYFLKRIGSGRNQDVFITSHSPFIVSDSKREDVYIFKRESKDTISVDPPRHETFGSSMEFILKMAFNIDDTLSKEASDFINNLLKERDPSVIEESLKELGDSSQLIPLYSRIEMLKDNK